MEDRPIVYERVELAMLATRIDVRRQVAQECSVELSASKIGIQPCRIHASHRCRKSFLYEGLG